MAQDIGTVYVQVKPSGKDFGKTLEGDITPSIDKAGAKGSTSLTSRIGGAFGKIGKIGLGTITGFVGGITALAAKGGFDRALNIENAKAKLKGLGHDSASVTEIMNDALASVKGTAFGLGDAATVAASLSASGVKQGGQLTNVLKTVADTAQISGRSITDIGTIFGSVAARGKLQGDDMLQLMSSGVPVLQLLAKHLNLTTAQVSDMVSKGKIDFQTFSDAMQQGLGGAALSAGTTFTGALSNVKAALSRLGEQVATPILDGLRGLFNQAIPLIDNFTATATPIMQKVGTGLQTGLENAIPAIQTFFTQLSQNSIVTALQSALQTLGASAKDTFGQLQYLAGGVATNSNVINTFQTVIAILSTVIQKLGGFIDAAALSISNFILGVSDAQGIQAFITAIQNIITTAGGLASSILSASTGILDFANTSGLAYGAGETLSGVLNILAAALEFVSQNMTWIKPLATGIGSIILASKGLGAVSDGLKGITTAAGGIEKGATAVFDSASKMSTMGGLVSGLKQWASNLTIVKDATAAWSAVTKAAEAISVAFQAVMAASWGPWLIGIAAITAVVGALTWFFTQTEVGRKAWSSFTSFLASSWQAVSSAAVSIWNGLGSFFSDLWSGITSAAQSAWSGFTDALTGTWNATVSAASGAWSGLTSFFTNLWSGIAGGVSTAWSAVVSAFANAASTIGGVMANIVTVIGAVPVWIGQQLLSGINGVFSTILNLLTGWAANSTGIVHTLLEGIISYVTTVWTVVSGIVSTGVNLIRTIVVAVVDLLQGDWQGAWTAISGFFQNTWNGIAAFFTPILTSMWLVIQTVLTTIQTTWNGVWQTVSDFFLGVWNGMVAFVAPIVTALSTALSTAITTIQTTWNGVWQSISDFFIAVWNGMVGFVVPILGALSGAIAGAAQAIAGTWNSVWSSIIGFFSGVWNRMVGAASAAVNAIGSVVGRIYGTVMGALSGAATWLTDVGRNIVSGLIGGIKGAFGWLKDTITSMGSNALSWAKGVLGIHSPSKVFREQVGVMIGRGMALGIDDSGSIVDRSLKSMNLKLTDGIGTVGLGNISTAIHQASDSNNKNGDEDLPNTAQVYAPVSVDARGVDGVTAVDLMAVKLAQRLRRH